MDRINTRPKMLDTHTAPHPHPSWQMTNVEHSWMASCGRGEVSEWRMDPRFTGIDKKKPRTVFSIRPILFYIYVSSA